MRALSRGGEKLAIRRVPLVAFVVVVLASGVAGWLVYVYLVQPGRPPGWDEAAHGLYGLLIAHDLRALDLVSLVLDAYRQVYWPPIHSLLVGGAFLVNGPSMESARLVSVAAFMLLPPTLFLVGRLVDSRDATLTGCVAAVLGLTSPGFIVYASENMLELPGLLALSLTVLVYAWLEKHPEAPERTNMLLGVAVMVTYLTKSNYGILLILSIGVTKLIEARLRPRQLLTRRNAMVLLPIVVIALLWFAYPPKLIATWSAMVNQPWGGESGRGLAGLLFYPRALVSLSGSRWMVVLLAAGLVIAWRARGSAGGGTALGGVTLLVVIATLQFVIGQIHHTKLTRHIIPMLPALYVLAGVAAAEGWAWARSRGRLTRVALVVGLLAVASLHAHVLVSRSWPGPVRRSPDEILGYVSRMVREHDPALVIGAKEAWPGPPVFDWHLAAIEGVLPVAGANAVIDREQERLLEQFARRPGFPDLVRASLSRVSSRYEAVRETRSYHLGVRRATELRQFETDMEAIVASAPPRAIIAIIAMSDTTRYPLSYVAPTLTREGYVHASVREFPIAGSRVHVYLPRATDSP